MQPHYCSSNKFIFAGFEKSRLKWRRIKKGRGRELSFLKTFDCIQVFSNLAFEFLVVVVVVVAVVVVVVVVVVIVVSVLIQNLVFINLVRSNFLDARILFAKGKF